MVQGLPHIEGKQHVCEGCAFGKQHRLPFPKGVSWRAKEKLELIHTDVCGPMDTLSHAQNRYFILFIDDHTRMTWVYFMRQKSEVFMIFKKFKSLVEKQSGCFIKTLRSDRGKEYTSKEFHNFCEDEGVERQLTVRYTPQQNGVTERKNQTIVEMAKSMMHEKGLPKIFWAEAVYTTVYLSNRCPTTAIPNKTPFEAWSGRRPSVNHLKLGQVIISRDVQVDENALWNWEENKVEKKDILISTDKEDEIEPSTPDSSSSQPNDESSTDPTSSNSSSPSATPKSDLGGSLDDMKSTSGYCFSFGSAIFSWVSKKQQSVAQSSAEAEYISASVATSQAIWLRKILADLGHHQIEGTVLHCDNKSAIAMAKNPVHHNRTRHIALKHHFIRQAIEDKEIQLEGKVQIDKDAYERQHKEFKEAKAMLSDQGERIEKLEAMVLKLSGREFVSEEKGSCSVKPQCLLDIKPEVERHRRLSNEGLEEHDDDDVKFIEKDSALQFTNLKYSRVEIDEVRFKWAECMLDYI
ncbi:hypothetical protein ZIOFF_006121 [Zingiber officinale]|uniref:Integrase catalytic domain-containing protein n=1 Tax=Zingiber officinale TaxID=94328 RepID=A0A8J5I2A4_ZINOF|nr:hypothetical protein ZIOFF_006121 [Zingiber officinale]